MSANAGGRGVRRRAALSVIAGAGSPGLSAADAYSTSTYRRACTLQLPDRRHKRVLCATGKTGPCFVFVSGKISVWLHNGARRPPPHPHTHTQPLPPPLRSPTRAFFLG